MLRALPVAVGLKLVAACLLRPDLHGGVAEEVVDGEDFGEGALVGVVLLGGEEGGTEPWVGSGIDLGEEDLVVEVGGLVDGETTGGEGGEGALAFGLDEGFGEGTEVGEIESGLEILPACSKATSLSSYIQT